MKKVLAILIACILVIMSISAIAEDSATTTCAHSDLEVAGAMFTKYVSAGSAYHRVLTCQKGYCRNPQCNFVTDVTIDSYTEAHRWYEYNDVHISDAKHIYYQRCNACSAETFYSKPCGGYHPIPLS